MNPPLIFGEIFFVNEMEYIFLGIDNNILYAAKILDIELSKRVERLFLSRVYENKTTNKTIFS